MIQNIAKFGIKYLDFRCHDITAIEDGAFANFTQLISLNFACNKRLCIDTVINALSSSACGVKDLILDSTNHGDNCETKLGRADYGSCRLAWTMLRRLSARYCHILGVNEGFAKCIPKLKALSIGYNNPYGYAPHSDSVPADTLRTSNSYIPQGLRSLDADFMFVVNPEDNFETDNRFGCDPSSRKAKLLDDKYFPPYSVIPPGCEDEVEEITTKSGMWKHQSMANQQSLKFRGENVTDVSHDNDENDCPTLELPRCLTYLSMANIPDMTTFCPGEGCPELIFYLQTITCLNFSENHLRLFNMSRCVNCKPYYLRGLEELEVLDISYMNLNQLPPSAMRHYPSLSSLNITRNVIGQINQLENPHLRNFDASISNVRGVDPNAFIHARSMNTLSLQNNSLPSVSFVTRFPFGTVSRMDFRYNALRSLSVDERAWFDQNAIYSTGTQLQLLLGENPYECSCDTLEFLQWFQSSPLFIVDKDDVKCFQDGQKGVPIMKVDTFRLKLKCKILIISLTSGLGLVVASATVVALLYRWRWRILWWRYKFKRKFARGNPNNRLIDQAPIDVTSADDSNTTPDRRPLIGPARYDVIPIFSHQDRDGDFAWVNGELRSKVEDEWGMRMHLVDRDDRSYWTVPMNLAEGIENSRCAIWVVTEDFCHDSMCEVAANFALVEYGKWRNVLISKGKCSLRTTPLPRGMQTLLHPGLGVQRLEYSDNPQGNILFWQSLKDFLTPMP